MRSTLVSIMIAAVAFAASTSGAVRAANGVPVMALSNIRLIGEDGLARALRSGPIQFQFEGTEILFRNLSIRSLRSLPRLVRAP
jgi:hypothetical protein